MKILDWGRSMLGSFRAARKNRSRPSTIRRARPGIEPLEDRLTPSANSTAIVNTFYQDLLHRAPDPGAAGFAIQIDKGVTPTAVAYQIETDPGNEYRLQVVARDYADLLKRTGSLPEWLGWARQMAAGITDEQVQAMIAGSTEYFALHGSTNAGFINGLYNDALGRPDSEGAFVSALNLGTPRQIVANSVFTSSEGLLHKVLADYDQFLGRDGSGDSGAAGFAMQMALGVTHEMVVADLIGSAEYLAAHQLVASPTAAGGQVDTSPSAQSDVSYPIDAPPVTIVVIVTPPPVIVVVIDPAPPVDPPYIYTPDPAPVIDYSTDYTWDPAPSNTVDAGDGYGY